MLNSTDELVTVRAPKRLDMLTCPHLAKDLETKIQQGRGIVLDLSKTLYMEPESAEVILQALMLAKQNGLRFCLRGVNSSVQVVLELAGVLAYFRKS